MSNHRNPGCPSHPLPSGLVSAILPVFLDMVSSLVLPQLLKYRHMLSGTHYWISTSMPSMLLYQWLISYYLGINSQHLTEWIIPIFLKHFCYLALGASSIPVVLEVHWLLLFSFADSLSSLVPRKWRSPGFIPSTSSFPNIHSSVTTVKFPYSTQISSPDFYLMNTSIWLPNRYLKFNM